MSNSVAVSIIEINSSMLLSFVVLFDSCDPKAMSNSLEITVKSGLERDTRATVAVGEKLV